MIQLYSAFYCPYALRTRFVLKEKGLAYEHTEIDLKNKPADFHTISPYGKVPVLLDGETRVYESAIINEYLDEAYPAPPLMPKEPARRAYVRIWIDFANARLMPASFRAQFGPEEGRASAQKEFFEHLATLNQEIGEKPWLAGEDFTLAEATYSGSFAVLDKNGVSLERFPNLSTWWRRISSRPSYLATGGLRGKVDYLPQHREALAKPEH